jgi:hypothetical protein
VASTTDTGTFFKIPRATAQNGAVRTARHQIIGIMCVADRPNDVSVNCAFAQPAQARIIMLQDNDRLASGNGLKAVPAPR